MYDFIKKADKSTQAVMWRYKIADCALIRVCAVIRLNTVFIFFFLI